MQLTTKLKTGLKRVQPVIWILIALAAIFYFLIPHYFWTRAKPLPGRFNVLSDKSESALSADGQTLIVARDVPERGSELYVLRKEGKAWGSPEPLVSVNSPFHETDPVLSHDGQYLFLSSDRPGGGGGYDLWVARWDGKTWRQPLNLGWGVNSRFDEFGPAVSHTTNRIYFASNRPDTRLSVSEKNLNDKELRREYPPKDLDLYYADYLGETLGKPVTVYALRDRRQLDEDLATRLGGSPGTEAAVKRALEWIGNAQEADGRWAMGRHGGQAGHDVAATALSLLALMGHGHKHSEVGPHQEQVDRGLKWLVKSTRPNGDMRSGNVNNGMYDQGMGTMALAEAYGLTRDEGLRAAAQAAINFVVAAQHKPSGGWRYKPGQAGDMSVFGWQIMAVNNALNAGLDVPEETVVLAEAWLNSVGTGEVGGLYGYQRGGRQPAMVAEGMFCRQLVRTPRNSARMKETATFIEGVDPSSHGTPFFYFTYYATLALYHHHIEYWDTWNGQLKDLLLDSQVKSGELKGSWAPRGAQGGSMGRLLSTALATLSLEIYYRYLPRYEFLEPEMADLMAPVPGAVTSGSSSEASTNDLPNEVLASVTTNSLVIPLFGAAWSLASINTDAHEAQPSISADGQTLFFASSRETGRGGADLYVSHLKDDVFEEARPIRGYLNTSADETDPAVASDGISILMSSNRESSSGARYRLYRSEFRRVTPITFLRNAFLYVLSLLEQIKWWLLVLLLVIAGILFLAKQFSDPRMRERYNLLQKCILGSILAHLLILLLTAFWKISTAVVSPTDARLEIAIDVNALAQEALALAIREDLSELPEAESATLAEQMEAPPPIQEVEPVKSEIEPIESETLKEVLALETPEIESPPEVFEIELPKPEVVLASIEMMETAFELEEAPEGATTEPETPDAPTAETMAKPVESIPESQAETVEVATEPTAPPQDLARIEMEPIEIASMLDLPEMTETPVLEQATEVSLPEMEAPESQPPTPEESPQIEEMAHRSEQAELPDSDVEPTDAPPPSTPPEPEALERTESLLAKLLEEADLMTDVEPVPMQYTNMTLVAALPLMKLEDGRPDQAEKMASSEPESATAPSRLAEPASLEMDHGEQEKAAMPSPQPATEIPVSSTPLADPAAEESRSPLELLVASTPVPASSPVSSDIRVEMEQRERRMETGSESVRPMSAQVAGAAPAAIAIERGDHENTDAPAPNSREIARESAAPSFTDPAGEESRSRPELLIASAPAPFSAPASADVHVEMEQRERRMETGSESVKPMSAQVAGAAPAAIAIERGDHENTDAPAPNSREIARESAVTPGRQVSEESFAPSQTLLETTLAMVRRVHPAEPYVEMESRARTAGAKSPGRPTTMNVAARSRPMEMTTEGGAMIVTAAVAEALPAPVAGAIASAVSMPANSQALETTRTPEALSPARTDSIDALSPVEMTLAMESGRPGKRSPSTAAVTQPSRVSASISSRGGGHPEVQTELGLPGAELAEMIFAKISQGAVPARASRIRAARPVELAVATPGLSAQVPASRSSATKGPVMDFQLETRGSTGNVNPDGTGELLAMVSAGHVLPGPAQHLRGRAGRAEMITAGVLTAATAPVSRTRLAGAPRPVEGRTTQPGIAQAAFAGNPDVPVTEILEDLILDAAPATLPAYYLRDPGRRGTVINRLGGGSDTEAAVRMALDWFTGAQEIDGRWSITRFGGQKGHDAGATGFVLLSYLGWGATHAAEGPYRESVSRGLAWLQAKMKEDGDLRDTDAENAMYSQGIATLALAEAFALTKDEKLREAAQRAVNFIVSAQNQKDGSWRYQPGDPGDTSVLGWQLMALTSARLAGLEVPDGALKNVQRWLRKVGGGDHGGLYGYRNDAPVASMVAEGMFCRQLLGTDPDSPIMKESALYISSTPVNLDSKTTPVYYYTYYGTLALHQHQGPAWQSWNTNMKRSLLASQDREGDNRGSWKPRGLYADRTGRLVATAMATLSLEVYYRYLPLYSFSAETDPK